MKVRIKFEKLGAMKFIGHLDTMRYFQKAVRRAKLPVAFSEGFSPHMIMSFAAPLGVGVTSKGEYFDMELVETVPTKEIRDRLQGAMAEGMRVVSAVKVEDGKASKAMSIVAASDYTVVFREGREFCENWKEQLEKFYEQPSVLIHKKTKRSEKTVDIRPYIYQLRVEGDTIFMRLASASSNYTKPDQVMSGFAAWLSIEEAPFAYMVQREEVYADIGNEQAHQFVTLESLGESVE